MKKLFPVAIGLLLLLLAYCFWHKGTSKKDANATAYKLSQTSSHASITSALKSLQNEQIPSERKKDIKNEKLTREFAQMLVNLHTPPSGEEFLAKLKEVDVDFLIDEYKHKTNLVNRIGLMWALALSEDKRVIDIFKNTLLNEFNGRVLHDPGGIEYDDQYVMIFTVFGFGLLATRHDQAFDFLRQGTDPVFWQRNIKWRTSDTGDSLGLLTAASIHALGVSGRQDVPGILEELKKKPLTNTADSDLGARTFDGDLLQAAFYYNYVK